VQALQDRCPEVTRLQKLAHAFGELVRKRQGAKLTSVDSL